MDLQDYFLYNVLQKGVDNFHVVPEIGNIDSLNDRKNNVKVNGNTYIQVV